MYKKDLLKQRLKRKPTNEEEQNMETDALLLAQDLQKRVEIIEQKLNIK